jgi:drug/metabolite transporter superfamily protein YnfA
MNEIINGWLAYILSNNSATTFVFAGVVVIVACLLVWVQMRKDQFDLRAIISTYKDGHYVPVTDKTLLVGCWLVSSYLVIDHYSETALAAYLTLWVANSGIRAIYKKNQTEQRNSP